ncbi:hypothetical protein IB276_26400 [Ensifer sp. ENS04]|uniref:hypothetical protein n=1 Tax=Ensifer sp. ENS04 TaxID=2769281 RepID=UPI0017862EB2|nr:hypothetical protein [Ensifer sp. ENS04]MBD9542981.1 hypothetical protein [Ensifer sp. ENS04]
MSGWLHKILGRETTAPEVAQEQPVAREHAPVGISIALKPEDIPRFHRTYSKRLSNKAVCAITMSNYYIGSGRMSSGELTQPNGRWVLFDPERIADKILDPALVPLIEEFAKQVMALDREFMKNRPSEFVDESGVVWRRAA